MRFQDLNWKDVESYLQIDNRVILVTGSTEQHAYLSLLTDVLIPSKIALAVAERESVLVAPAFNFGVTPGFSDFPGTISLSRDTFDAVLYEIVESLMHQGFARFLILNGHSGNELPARIAALNADGGIRVVWLNWWETQAVKTTQAQLGMTADHANWIENFTFTRVGDLPDDVRDAVKPKVNLELQDEGQSLRDILGDGNLGGAYQIDDATMTGMYLNIVEEVIDQVRALKDG
jgi:creatinine amidohydrolase